MSDAEAEEEAYYEEKMVKEYEDEIERLRTALREISEFDAANYKWKCQQMRRIAKEALGDE